MKQRTPIALDVLRQIALFRTLDEAQLHQVQPLLKERRYRKGQALFYQGDPGDCLYLLSRGRLRIFLHSPDGREATVRVYGPGSVVGELAVLDGKPRSAGAVALDDLATLVLYRDDMLRLLREHFAITERVLTTLTERVRYTTSYSEQLVFLSAPGRIASALLQLAGVEADATQPARLELTQQELATFAGTTREWGNRALHDFAEAGLVMIERGAVTVLDRAGLERRVG